LRTNNPFSNAFNDLEYIEPSEEEVQASQEIADKYMEEQEKEEQEWFIQQEKALLKQLINDYKVEEFIGGKPHRSFI
jgi:type IV secretory pathway TraG/TraD family ATPase VirD4